MKKSMKTKEWDIEKLKNTAYKWNIEKLRKLARAVKEDEMEIKRMEMGYCVPEDWRHIENAITDYINPYPASCYRKLNVEKLCKFLFNLTNNI